MSDRDRSSTRRARVLAAAALLMLAAAGPAAAQVCGDADGNGTVTVTDGVATLRSAAGLSSACTAAACDVDGNGSTTVTDGVNVLRKAAGLSSPDACTGGGTAIAEVEEVTAPLIPLFAFGLALLTEASPLQAAPAQLTDTDDCPAGGSRTKRIVSINIINIELDQCGFSNPALGSFVFDGVISVNFARTQVVFRFTVSEAASSQTANFDGFFSFGASGDGFVGDGGPIAIVTPQGTFNLTLDKLTIDGDGRPISGGGIIEEQDDVFTLQSVRFEVNGQGGADLIATFDDQTTRDFLLNLDTGALIEQ